jgi:hypothetical protein
MRSIFTGPNFIICGGQDQLAAPKRPWPLARVLSYWPQHFPTPKRLQIVLARPLAIPRLPPRIIRVEVQAAQCLPAAMRTALNVAVRAMALADRRAAVGTGSEFLAHASFPKPEINCRALINKRSQVAASLCSDWYTASCAITLAEARQPRRIRNCSIFAQNFCVKSDAQGIPSPHWYPPLRWSPPNMLVRNYA